MTNGVQETPQQPGPKVYGVVQRTGSDKQQEVMACEWSVNHLRDEMRYIKEVSGGDQVTGVRLILVKDCEKTEPGPAVLLLALPYILAC